MPPATAITESYRPSRRTLLVLLGSTTVAGATAWGVVGSAPDWQPADPPLDYVDFRGWVLTLEDRRHFAID